MKKIILMSIAFVLVLLAPVNAGEITVNADGTGDYPTIQDAINNSNNGDVIILQPGTYTGTGNRDIDFLGKAIAVRSTDPNDPNIVAATIIDCNGSYADPHRGFYFHNGEDANSILDGLTITGGIAYGSGGGIYCEGSSPTIADCIIASNEAYDGGGGIYLWRSDTTIKDCTISKNSAGYWEGGGIFCGPYSNVTIANCTISENSTDLQGGGISLWGAKATIYNCTISKNLADWFGGGGISCYDEGNTAITNCTISENSTNWGEGGGIFCEWDSDVTINDSTIIANTASHSVAGGIFFSGWGESEFKINNCTIVNNSAYYAGGGIFLVQGFYKSISTISNCILYYNQASQGPQIYLDLYEETSFSIKYSNIEGGYIGEGNIDADPCFADPCNNDYHLLPNSPCIDTGDPNFIPEPNETDLDGKPRLVDGDKNGIAIVDMGVYEYRPPLPAEVSIEPPVLNLASKGNWLTCQIRLPEDYNIADIDPNSVFLEDIIAAESLQINNDAAVVKFSRSEVQSILSIGENEITVTGELLDGTIFEGSNTIRVINKGGKN